MKFSCYIEGTGSVCHVKFWLEKIASVVEPNPNKALKPMFYPIGENPCFDKVQIVCICDTAVNFFPRGIAEIFLNIKSLEIINCGIKKITRNDLRGLERLTSLHLDGNELRTLPKNLLTGMKNLTYISFNSNKIIYLESSMLKDISRNKIEMIDFEKNPAIDACYATTLNGFSSKSCESLEDLIKLIDETFPDSLSCSNESDSDTCITEVSQESGSPNTSSIGSNISISETDTEFHFTDDSSYTGEGDSGNCSNRAVSRQQLNASDGLETDTSEELYFVKLGKLRGSQHDFHSSAGVNFSRNDINQGDTTMTGSEENIIETFKLASILQLSEKRDYQEKILLEKVERLQQKDVEQIFNFIDIGYETNSLKLMEAAYEKAKLFYGELKAIEALVNLPIPIQKYFAGIISSF